MAGGAGRLVAGGTIMGLSGQLAALCIGALFGALTQRGHFCTMGCVSDAVLFGSFRRSRVWALAAATALIGSQALDLAGAIHLDDSTYLGSPRPWLWSVVGGLLFGFGTVLAGGCVSRNLVRVGAGSVKALVTLVVVLTSALATLASVQELFGNAAGRPQPALPELVAAATGVPPATAGLFLTLGIAGGLLAFALRARQLRREPAELLTGMALGSLVPLAWLADASPAAVNFVAPGVGFGPVVALVAGTVLGSAATARALGRLRVETFAGRADLVRHLTGGALMGVGGALAAGCTVGHGLSGISTLSPASWLAVAAMLVGAWWGIKHLETGRLLPFLPSASARTAG